MTRFTLALTFLLAGNLTGYAVAQDEAPNVPPVLLKMIRDTSVHDELKLDESQRQKIESLLPKVDGRWFRSRNFQQQDQRKEISVLTAGLQRQLQSVLNATQLKRLKQLERQALGTRMMTMSDVASTLKIRPEVQDKFIETFLNTDRKSIEYQQKMMKGEMEQAEAQSKLTALQTEERNLFTKLLTDTQRSRIGSLTGEPFDFSKVKRSLPMAPEFTSKGVTWIQGGPQKLEELRGKVVAVHFYAFQCINCQRNLPHYKEWFKDYEDDGLVVIGIQTPETSAEKKTHLVADAAKQEGIRYPLIMDSESSNWTQWNNTMWPTVYLIDKRGYLRRWWQGELNWKGTPGEKQMRTTIEQLLSEDS